MTDNMPTQEALEMMRHCKSEIVSLRADIERLRPKAEAYDNIAAILGLLPRPSRGAGLDLVWQLEKRIRELTPPPVSQP